jgi:SpoVK/Ycf46/Vps4 family AAA+-type ATPase
MARSDLLISLVKAAKDGDSDLLRRTIDAVVAEERAKNHHVLADRLEQVARENGRREKSIVQTPIDQAPALAELHPTGRTLEDLILASETKLALRELIEEQRRADLLRSHGLEPRHRVLLAGPPGNGKTALSDALAFELAIPLLSVRYERLVASLLGETSARLQRVFEYAQRRHCLLFFDEFDTLGKERGDTHETGEIKRVVSSLLLQIDALPSYVVVVVATNHPELLDRAVWRRFELRLHLPKPTREQREEWFIRVARQTGDLGFSPRTLADKFREASFSELNDFALDVSRRLLLAEPGTAPRRVVIAALEQRAHRYSLE